MKMITDWMNRIYWNIWLNWKICLEDTIRILMIALILGIGIAFLLITLTGCGGSGIGSTENSHDIHDDPIYCQNVNPNCTK